MATSANATEIFGRADRLFEEKRYREASHEVEMGLGIEPKNYWGISLDAYAVAANLDSTSATAMYGIGFSCWKLGRIDEAIMYFAQSSSLDPNFVDPYISKFQCELGALRLPSAVRSFIRAYAFRERII